MTSNEHFQQRVALLNEYAQCLQKQNKAKSQEIAVLHEHLGRVDGENQYLRGVLDEMRNRFEHREKNRNISCSLQTSINLDEEGARADACCQTNEEEEEECIGQINQILTLTQRINEKDATIAKYHRECEEMFEAIEKLQTENKNFILRLNADKDIMNKLEERLRREEQRRTAAEQRLEDASYNIYNAGEEVENYKRKAMQCESELENLILENNSLIERIRGLQREKNEYYHEIKRMSRVSFGNNESLGKSAVKKSRKVSDQRFKQIEEHLRKVQMENQAIQSNLMITR